jgi:hypothetical protein
MCYQQYPYFQVAEFQVNKTKLSQNTFKLGQTQCSLHFESQHASAECKKLSELKSSGLEKGKRTGKGKGKRVHFSSHSATRTYPSFKKGKHGGAEGKNKGNRSKRGDTLNPFKDMECSHCEKKGQPARNCYRRLNAQPTTLSQNKTIITEPDNTIAFQQ